MTIPRRLPLLPVASLSSDGQSRYLDWRAVAAASLVGQEGDADTETENLDINTMTINGELQLSIDADQLSADTPLLNVATLTLNEATITPRLTRLPDENGKTVDIDRLWKFTEFVERDFLNNDDTPFIYNVALSDDSAISASFVTKTAAAFGLTNLPSLRPILRSSSISAAMSKIWKRRLPASIMRMISKPLIASFSRIIATARHSNYPVLPIWRPVRCRSICSLSMPVVGGAAVMAGRNNLAITASGDSSA